MNCKKIRKLLVKDQETLSEEEKKTIALHIKTCKECRNIFQTLSNLEELTKQLKTETVPAYLTENLWEQVKKQITNKSLRKEKEIFQKRFSLHPALVWSIPSLGVVCLLLWLVLAQPWKSSSRNNKFSHPLIDIVIESAQIDRKNAQIAVFETKNPDITFIWLEKQKTED